MKTKSAKPGKSTSAIEVTNVSRHGFWLLLNDVEHFLPFAQFPWFRDATIGQLLNVELPSSHHLYWPQLDVDLHVDSLTQPEKFPVISSAGTNGAKKQRARPRGKGK
jgi:hypothetical protein